MAQEFAFVTVDEDSVDNIGIEIKEELNIDLTESPSNNLDDYNSLVCPVCQITLENRKLWSEHVKIVHNNRRHKCDRCGKLYPSKTHRDRHFIDVHLAEKTHRCAFCNIFYKRRNELIRHYRNKHSEKEQNLVIDSVTLADLSTEYDVTYAHPCDKCYRCFKVFLKNFGLIKGKITNFSKKPTRKISLKWFKKLI